MEFASVVSLVAKIILLIIVTVWGLLFFGLSVRPFTPSNIPKDIKGELSSAFLSGISIGLLFVTIYIGVGIFLWDKPNEIESLTALLPVLVCITIPIIILSFLGAFLRFQYIKALKKGVKELVNRSVH